MSKLEREPGDDTPARLFRIDALCDRYEDDCKAGKLLPLVDFLRKSGIDPTIAPSELVRELAKLETLYRNAPLPPPPSDTTTPHFPRQIDFSDSKPSPSGSNPASTKPELGAELIGGKYTLIEMIGEGGMGSVYLARQSEPVKRDVALKLIKCGFDSKTVLARFDAERQALALMDHPNIARVYDGGTTATGQPFFVMELVKGVPLTHFCDQKRLPIQARLELFVQVCQAVQHAHQKGIIHRDLKPGNVLVTEVDGRPTPKVIDFGVAKATEQRLTDLSYADTGAIVGTPAYMSPEQADPSSMDIDTRTDVYALGVMLYELLTGSPPHDPREFKRGAILEMLRMVREVEPPRPSTKLRTSDALPQIAANRNIAPAELAGLLRGELDWVVMKALEKDRNRRYDTPNRLADDVQSYLTGEPVKAVPPSTGYRLKIFLRRNRASLAVATAFVLLLVAGVVVSAWQAVVAKGERDRAIAAQEALRLTLTRQVADRMEADLLRLSAVGVALAATVEEADNWDEKRLEAWKRRMLEKEPQIAGLSLAFEPNTFDLRPTNHPGRQSLATVVPFGFDAADPTRDGYSLYVYRKRPSGKVVAEPLEPGYKYRTLDWYTDTLSGKHSGWCEPGYDLYAGGTPMVSYLAPVQRRGDTGPIGVLAVELTLDYFTRMDAWLKHPNFGKDSYGFVLSGTGRLISHPHLGPNPLARKVGEHSPDIREIYTDEAFRDLVQRMLTHTDDAVGQATAVDPATGRSSRFLYARFKPAGWLFVAVIPGTTD